MAGVTQQSLTSESLPAVSACLENDRNVTRIKSCQTWQKPEYKDYDTDGSVRWVHLRAVTEWRSQQLVIVPGVKMRSDSLSVKKRGRVRVLYRGTLGSWYVKVWCNLHQHQPCWKTLRRLNSIIRITTYVENLIMLEFQDGQGKSADCLADSFLDSGESINFLGPGTVKMLGAL